MRNLNYLTPLFFVVAIFFGCQNTQSNIPTKEIIIYGAESCHHCRDLKTSLDSAGWKYEFNDVEVDMTKHQKMLDLIQQHQITGRISYPVVLFGDQLVIGANISKLIDKI